MRNVNHYTPIHAFRLAPTSFRKCVGGLKPGIQKLTPVAEKPQANLANSTKQTQERTPNLDLQTGINNWGFSGDWSVLYFPHNSHSQQKEVLAM